MSPIPWHRKCRRQTRGFGGLIKDISTLSVCQGNSFTGMLVKLAGSGFLWVTQGVMKDFIFAPSLTSALMARLFLNLFGYSRCVGASPGPGVGPVTQVPAFASESVSLCVCP